MTAGMRREIAWTVAGTAGTVYLVAVEHWGLWVALATAFFLGVRVTAWIFGLTPSDRDDA